MSAFIVKKENINTLVNFLNKTGKLRLWNPEINESIELTPEQIGQELLNANTLSVNTRYRENDQAETFNFKLNTDRVEMVQILKFVSCYEYQSCEYDGFEGSLAKRICLMITSKAIRNLEGYEQAKWD